MKASILVAIFCIFSASSASALTLSQAFDSIFAELVPALHSMTLQWEYYGMYDRISCNFLQVLYDDWNRALAVVYANEVYVNFRNELHAGNVPWDNFMSNDLEPGIGYQTHFRSPQHICTTQDMTYGIDFMRVYVKSAFESRQTYIQDAVNAARTGSAEYAAIFNRISANTQAGIDLRCSAEMQQVYRTMDAQEFELNFFFEIFTILFGLQVPTTC
jgi:hypothetical protein